MVETPPRLGVVTVTYNSAGVLVDFLRSVKAQTLPSFALYTVDTLRPMAPWIHLA
jgi:GT2 family glycosyltransferase